MGEIGGSVDEVEAAIIARDRKDSTRVHSPLTETDDAVVVDTTGMTIDEVVEHILELLPRMSKPKTFMAGNGIACPHHVLRRLLDPHPGDPRLHAHDDQRARAHPQVGTVRARPGASVVRRHADRRLRDVAPDALHGQGHDVEQPRRSAGSCRRSAPFPVTRGTADREALARCIAVLEGGEPLVLFPEGERKSGPVVQPLFAGAVYVAIKAGVPIVPVGIGGSERVMPKKAKFVYPRKVHIEIGPPIPSPTGGARRAPRTARLQGAQPAAARRAATPLRRGDVARPLGLPPTTDPEGRRRSSQRLACDQPRHQRLTDRPVRHERRRDRRRRTARAPSASTVAVRRRRPWRCRAASR